jgi:hypothetical protein
VTKGGEFGTPGAFLPKPFTADALSRAVKRVLGAVGVASPAERRSDP